MESKILQLFVNGAGQKIKTSGNLTISQYSTNNELHLITIGELASVTATFRDPAGNLSSLYHMVLQGKYALTEDDQEAVLVENADNLYDYFLPIPKKVSGIFVSGASARLNVSFAGYAYDSVSNVLKQSMTAATQIIVNKADSSVELDEGYNAIDVENMWIALNENAAKDIVQDGRLTTLESDNTSNKNRLTAVEGRVTTLEGDVSSLGTRMTAAEGAISGIKNGTSINSFGAVETALNTKQSNLIAGDNIILSGSNISAIDTKYTPGFGLTLDPSNKFDVNTTFIQEKLTAGPGVTINGGVISFSGLAVTYEVVENLPQTGQAGYIYLVPNSGSSPNIYDEYIWVNQSFEKIGTTQTDLSNYYTKSQANANVPLHQANTVLVADALTNISGRNLSNYTATLTTDQGYKYYQITYQNTGTITEEQVKTYMKTMTGSELIPVYDYNFPVNTYLIMSNGSIWKPQYDNANGLRLYKAGGDLLSNNKSLISDTNNTYDLGSSTYKWKDLYLSGYLKDGTNSILISNLATLSGDQTITGNKTFSNGLISDNINSSGSDMTIFAYDADDGYGEINLVAGDDEAEGYVNIKALGWNSSVYLGDEGVVGVANAISFRDNNDSDLTLYLYDLPTSDTNDSNQVWNNNGVLCVGGASLPQLYEHYLTFNLLSNTTGSNHYTSMEITYINTDSEAIEGQGLGQEPYIGDLFQTMEESGIILIKSIKLINNDGYMKYDNPVYGNDSGWIITGILALDGFVDSTTLPTAAQLDEQSFDDTVTAL